MTLTRKTTTAAALALSLLSATNAASAQASQAVQAGPIWNQTHADRVCPELAFEMRKIWTGHWWTTVPGQMSVCQLRDLMPGEGLRRP